ncbi:MAG: penicillin-binding protein [Bacteroidetes bacterium]|nr:penicillin-binding protein [Bacteroidota bacterium]MDA1121081.1 penicillin-binding protein [Bacteroidota bacterium]
MSIKRSIVLRVRIAYLAMLLFAGSAIYQILNVQFRDGEKWKARGQEIGFKYQQVKATRGNIYSDNSSLLATSLPFYRVALDPSIADDQTFAKGLDSLATNLSKFFGDRPASYYKRSINNSRQAGRKYLLLNSRDINYQDKKLISTWPILREGQMKGGAIFEKIDKRFNPFSYLGFRTIGNIDEEQNRGLVGLEYSFNTQLAGKNGEALFQKIAGGSWKPAYSGTEIAPRHGWDIETTIDVNLQDVAESALLKALKEHNADYGSLVLMEVQTGEIKAISNLSKNPEGNYWERYNYAVASQGSTEPGSTFKLASMIALLEDSNISPNDTIDTGNGEYQFYNLTMKDHKPGGFGKITIQEVFEKSSNIGIAKLVTSHFGSNPEKFIRYIEKMGLTKPLGFQIIGEGYPYIKTPSDSTWTGVSLPWMSHGYELKLTPLHMLSLYNAVANNGKMIQPIIVKSVKNVDRTVEQYEARVINKSICSEKTLKTIKTMLEGVVERGTAQNISGGHYKIAGKTGTAKKLKNGRYVNEYYTSFAGYFPADKPKYSCIVVIDNPKRYRIYGSDVAAPVFKEIADKIYAVDLELHEPFTAQASMENQGFPLIRSGNGRELQKICDVLGVPYQSNPNVEWARTKIEDNVIRWSENDVDNIWAPNVEGMTLRDAIFLLENKGLNVKVNGFGRVTKQSIRPGLKFNRGDEILIELS